MKRQIKIDGIEVQLIKKRRMRNMNLTVCMPEGDVRVSGPFWATFENLRTFVMSNIVWIKQKQKEVKSKPHYLDGESHSVWGEPYQLVVSEGSEKPSVKLDGRIMRLKVCPEASFLTRKSVINEWYKHLVRKEALPLIEKWEPLLGVKINRLSVRQMKTLWGSCTFCNRSIRISSELAKKPKKCLEYIVLHEMVHLLEQRHNIRFKTLLDLFMPDWTCYEKMLKAGGL